MLSEIDKDRILREELYRLEVRSRLDNDTKSSNPVFSFLDTQHGAMIVSAVLIPIFIWIFSTVQVYYSTKAAEGNYVSKLDSEITYRITNYDRFLTGGSLDKYKLTLDRENAFPQFAGFAIQGLMLELEKSLPESERVLVKKARMSLISGSEEEVLEALNIRGWRTKV